MLRNGSKEMERWRVNYSEQNLKDEVKKLTGGQGINVIYNPVGSTLFENSAALPGAAVLSCWFSLSAVAFQR